MMTKTYMNLCSNIYEEKCVADAIDERENNKKTDFHAYLKELMVNSFGLVSIATEMLNSFMDYTIKYHKEGHRAKLMGMLAGVIHPNIYTPYAADAMLVRKSGILNYLNCIR
jgi:hypothetical protein